MSIVSEHDEPRIQDLHLAEKLGFANPYMIRTLIERNRPELERFGEVLVMATKTRLNSGNEVFFTVKKTPVGGRPGKDYYLNRKQVLYICAKSQTPNAAEVTITMVEVFDAWMETERPVPVKEHFRSKPKRQRFAEPQMPLLPAPTNGAGFQIEPLTHDLRRFSVVTTDRVCFALAQHWLKVEQVAA